MERVFKVVAGLMDNEDLCTKLQRLIDKKLPEAELRILSICIVNGSEVAYCVEQVPNVIRQAQILKLVRQPKE